jgi:prephenate dehydrogenase
MKVAILGAKNVGSTLARQWARAGHAVMFGVRKVENPEVQALAQELGAIVGTSAEAIAFGEVIVFAIPGNAMEETIAAHGPALAGKIVVDAGNRMGGGPMNSSAALWPPMHPARRSTGPSTAWAGRTSRTRSSEKSRPTSSTAGPMARVRPLWSS